MNLCLFAVQVLTLPRLLWLEHSLETEGSVPQERNVHSIPATQHPVPLENMLQWQRQQLVMIVQQVIYTPNSFLELL